MRAIILFVATLFATQAAQADTLKCASKKDEHLYYTDGQLLLVVKDVAAETLMFGSSLSLQPEGKLGANEKTVRGSFKGDGKWVRFDIGGDAWCSYRLALPRGFSKKEASFPAFVDAYCEENSNYSIRMSCKIDR